MTTIDYLLDYIRQDKIPEGKYAVVIINGIDVHVGKLDGEYWVGITGIHAALNCGTKCAANCAYKWFKNTIMKNGKFNTILSTADGSFFTDIKTGNKDSGTYMVFDEIDFVVVLSKTKMALAARNWLRGFIDWDEGNGEGWLYLIQLPSKHGTYIFKYGKTIYPIARWRVYLHNEPEEFRKLGILIFCLVFTDNTSAGEDALGKVITPKNGCRIVEGNEHFEVVDPECDSYTTAIDIASDLFEKAIGYSGIEDDGQAYDYASSPGAYVFKLDKDKV